MDRRIKPYKTKHGTKYQFRAYLGTDALTGKRVAVTRSGFNSKKEANQVLNELQNQFNKNKYDVGSGLTVDQVFEKFLVGYKNDVKPVTLKNKKSYYTKHIKDMFGDRMITKVKPVTIQEFIDEEATKWKDINNVYGTLNQIFSYALRLDIIHDNPMTRVKKPKRARKMDFKPYTPKELGKFMKVLKTGRIDYYAYFRVLAYSGARRGEVMALTRDHVNFKKNYIYIDKTAINGKQTSTTKTDNSIRRVPLDKETMQILKKYMDSPLCGVNYLWQRDSNSPLGPSNANFWLKTIYNDHPELRRINVHGFRHTHASILIAAGVPVTDVAQRLGDTVEMITSTYAHALKQANTSLPDVFSRKIGV
ncbi:site-specific integrase [Ligilactobacillus acidipiscis]|uniref:site-specific integrase n=1 Tax=Ligilactobacillus acidipiscis TaxID=89059 RepID=UPI0023F8BE31|nr:site-specific integrase [Ligilactobacillus acidipiscis]WEV57832.1 site-specific integrase [Ligilactobacillus acidipiscis]